MPRVTWTAWKWGYEFTYRKGRDTFTARLKDIVYLEVNVRKITVHFHDGSDDEFYGVLSEVYEAQLKAADFLLIHAAYAVNYDYVTEVGFNSLSIQGSALPVARNRRAHVRRQYADISNRRRLG